MPSRRFLSVAALGTTLAVAGLGPTVAAPSAPLVHRAQVPLARRSADAQARRLGPLRATADLLGRLGRKEFRASATDVHLDPSRGDVDLMVTSTGTGRAMLRRLGTTPAPVRVVRTRYSAAQLDDAALALVGSNPTVQSVAPASDGSGLTATETASAARTAPVARIHGIPVQVTGARTTTPKIYHAPALAGVLTAYPPAGWAAVKWHDSSPFIGGDVMTRNGTGFCTTGLPAIRIKTGRRVMVGAGHCLPVGANVYTGAGNTWAYGNGQKGAWIGAVIQHNLTWDASVIRGASNAGDESDTSTWKPLVGAGYSYTGDYVCHSGARSASKGHATPCGIKVTKDDVYWRIGGGVARGVEGIDQNGWGCINGDSGATVWAMTARGRQARGQISSGGLDGTPDQKRVDWVEAPDILRYYGLKLNPYH